MRHQVRVPSDRQVEVKVEICHYFASNPLPIIACAVRSIAGNNVNSQAWRQYSSKHYYGSSPLLLDYRRVICQQQIRGSG